MQQHLHSIGFVINPICGMGGAVGLRGTDGRETLETARKLGAKPKVQKRAKTFLTGLNTAVSNVLMITPPGIMGEEVCLGVGIPYECIPNEIYDHKLSLYATTKADTQLTITYFKERKVELIVFLGGDGTACDILEIIQQDIPCLGIPGGVKVFSSVFASSPSYGVQLITQFIDNQVPVAELEVLDIDEEAFRHDKIQVKLFGYLKVPYIPVLIQGMKQSSPSTDDETSNQQAIARTIIEEMVPKNYYLCGPGTTVRMIFDLLGLKKTLLGFDILKNRKIIARDVNESQILDIIGNEPAQLIISPIGRQGFVFGRGNLQITPRVMQWIGKENIRILCSRTKLKTLPEGCLRTDIRNPEMDEKLRGYYRVLIDYNEYKMVKMI